MKRIIAVFSAVVIMISIFLCPMASANIADAYLNSNFAQYMVNTLLTAGGAASGTYLGVGPTAGAWLGAAASEGVSDLAEYYSSGHTDQDFYDAYNSDVSSYESTLGTAIFTSGGLRIPVIPTGPLSIPNELCSYTLGATTSGTVGIEDKGYSNDSSASLSFDFSSPLSNISAPFDCVVSGNASWSFNSGTDSSGGRGSIAKYLGHSCTVFSGAYIGLTYPCTVSFKAIVPAYSHLTVERSFSLTCWLDVVPSTGSVADHTTLDVSAASRPTVLVGSYGHGGNTYENVTIVNEGDSTYFNPVTGETVSYSTWAYDYATRTYTLYDADGNVIAVIQYGDDKLTIQTPDESYDINYVVPDSSGGSGSGGTLDPGESGAGSSLLDKIKDGIVGALEALIEGVFALIKTILEKLLGLAKDLLSFVFDFLTDTVLGGIKNLFSAFGDSGGLFEGLKGEDGGFHLPESEGVAGAFAFISGVVGILPAEIRSVLIFGIGAIFLFAILRKAGD